MPTERLLLIGAGGHAKVVCDAIRAARETLLLEVRDDDATGPRRSLLDYQVGAPVGEPSSWPDRVHVAIGDNGARRNFGEMVLSSKKILHAVTHPAAVVSAYSKLGGGVFVAARAVIAPAAVIETGSIINHGAVIDHDCRVGAWSHIAPGVVLGGAVTIGEMCLIGSGAIILPGVSVGGGAVVGSGAVVTRDIDPGMTVIGVPARSSSGSRARGNSS